VQTFKNSSPPPPCLPPVASATNLDVIQEVEYVKQVSVIRYHYSILRLFCFYTRSLFADIEMQEARIVYLLECLQKTAPPAIIFCENKADVDDIHEYLLLKGVNAVSSHGGKSQEDREFAMKAFKTGRADVIIATDVAAKGLDFPDVQHVINFDMPKEIETYVHRIGRTGRCGKTGVATTFINKNCSEAILLDLKFLLSEAKQRIPPVLMQLEDPDEDRRAAMAQSGTALSTITGITEMNRRTIFRAQRESAVQSRTGGGSNDY
jgi:ATP-dependent RNA helicase DDX41